MSLATLAVAPYDGYFFRDARTGDLIVRTLSRDQAILLGVASSSNAPLRVDANGVCVAKPSRTTGALLLTTSSTSNSAAIEVSPQDAAVHLRVNGTEVLSVGSNKRLDLMGDLNLVGGNILRNGTLLPDGVPAYEIWATAANLNSAYLVPTAASRVGIGTSNPLAALDVAGDVRLSGDLLVNGVPVLQQLTAASSHLRAASNSTTLWLGPGSNLALGKSNASATLDVLGSINLTGDLLKNGVPFSWSNASSSTASTGSNSPVLMNGSNAYLPKGRSLGVGTSNPTAALDVAGDLNVRGVLTRNGTPIPLSQWTSGPAAVYMLGYNVGIGTGNPNASLDVVGDGRFSGNVYSRGQPLQAQVMATAGCNLYIAGGSNLGLGLSNPSCKLDVVGDVNVSGSFMRNGVPLASSPWTPTPTGSVVVVGSNVGVNTATPGFQLDVVGDVNAQGVFRVNGLPVVTSGTPIVPVANKPSCTLPLPSNLGIGVPNPQYPLDVAGDINLRAGSLFRIDGVPIRLSPFSQQSSAYSLPSGSNLGIGTAAPACALDVVGGTRIAAAPLSLGSQLPSDAPADCCLLALDSNQPTRSILLGRSGNDAVSIAYASPDTATIRFASGASNTGRVVVEGTLHSTQDITTASDARLKRDVRPLTGALDRLAGVRGYTYELASDPARRRHVGLLAQEVRAALPEAVSSDEDGTLSIAYGNLLGLVVEAIREVGQRLDGVQAALSAMASNSRAV